MGREGGRELNTEPNSHAATLVLLNPSANSRISQIRLQSGTTMAMGRNMDFKLSGSSVRPA